MFVYQSQLIRAKNTKSDYQQEIVHKLYRLKLCKKWNYVCAQVQKTFDIITTVFFGFPFCHVVKVQ